MKFDDILWKIYEPFIIVVLCCAAIYVIPILYLYDKVWIKRGGRDYFGW